MAAKTRLRATKRKNAKASGPLANGAPILSMITRNLINMVVVCAVSGAVLLGLLSVKYF